MNPLLIFFAVVVAINCHEMDHGTACEPGNTEHFCSPAKYLDCIDFMCECIEGLVVSSNKTCFASYNSPCTTGVDSPQNTTCSSDSFLVCDSFLLRTCTCVDNPNMKFDTSLKSCALLVGKECAMTPTDQDAPCVANAHCKMEGSNHICACNAGYELSTDGKTCESMFDYVGYGETCDAQNGTEIISGLVCDPKKFLECPDVTRKCICLTNKQMVYNDLNETCALALGEECSMTPSPAVPSCGANAYCKMEGSGSNMTHLCACNLGYESSPDGKTCESSYDHVGYNETCIAQDENGNTFEKVCDPKKFLECSVASEKCICQTSKQMVYNTVNETCALALGEVCEMFPTSADPTCGANAYCKMEMTGSDMTHLCDCVDGYQSDGNQLCIEVGKGGDGGASKVIFNYATFFSLFSAFALLIVNL